MLSVKDLLNLQKLVSDVVAEQLKQFYEEHIKYLPTKKEHFKKMDEVMTEVQAVRDSQELHSESHRTIDDRFEKIDKHLSIDSSVP